MNYCTYFDSNYFAQGMALLRSLQRWDAHCHVAVLALDKRAFELIPRGPGITVELRETQGAENIWRLTPWWIRRAGKLLGYPITYLDADMYAFGPVVPVVQEYIGSDWIALPRHRWTAKYKDRLEKNGKYNVGCVVCGLYSADDLTEWENWCAKWKPAGAQPRFMDQLFFDEYRATPIHSLGVNLAPYNQQQYTYAQDGHKITVSDGTRTDRFILYHFHEWRCKRDERGKLTVTRTGYPLHPFVEQVIYPAYEQESLQYAL